MAENSEKQAREAILQSVAEYCRTYHHQKPYAGGDRIPYARRVYDEDEMCALVDSALDFWLTAGRYADAFEQDLASIIGVRHCSLVNSGSAANLLALMALTSPLLGEKRLRRGDEVITVAAGFPTTVAPAVQFGAVPVFVDVSIPQYNINTALLEDAYSEKTRAVFIAHTMGNPFDVAAVKAFCNAHGLWLLEDNCDALGSEYTLDGTSRRTGSFGHLATSSFYPPHHLTMGEGGAVYTNDALLHKIVRSLRDWGRDCTCPPGADNRCGRRFSGQYGALPRGYDHKYVYSHFGYNLKATDMQAAIGTAQLKKLPGFVAKRRHNFARLHAALQPCAEKLLLPQAAENSVPSWFGFLMTCQNGADKNTVVKRLEDEGIQTRALFAGNLLRHPCFDEMRQSGQGYRVAGGLEVTDRIMRDTFWVGVYPGMDDNTIDAMAAAIARAVG